MSAVEEGAALSPEPQMIETASGRFLDLLKPNPDDIYLSDIASGLSKCCRYAGQIKVFYSVAEHSVLVHDLVRHEWKETRDTDTPSGLLQAALFHDAAEAYIGDITSPAKFAMRKLMVNVEMEPSLGSGVGFDDHSPFDEIEMRVMSAICQRFDMDASMFEHPLLRKCDLWACRVEAGQLTRTGGVNWRFKDIPEELPSEIYLSAGHLSEKVARVLWVSSVSDYIPELR